MVEAGTLCINADVEKYSGANASATSDDEAYTNVYIKQAEGYISGLVRDDVVTNYATYKSTAKELFREMAARLAAIGVISYDLSGYTSRIEAEDMLNMNWSRIKQIKKTLEDQNFITWGKT